MVRLYQRHMSPHPMPRFIFTLFHSICSLMFYAFLHCSYAFGPHYAYAYLSPYAFPIVLFYICITYREPHTQGVGHKGTGSSVYIVALSVYKAVCLYSSSLVFY